MFPTVSPKVCQVVQQKTEWTATMCEEQYVLTITEIPVTFTEDYNLVWQTILLVNSYSYIIIVYCTLYTVESHDPWSLDFWLMIYVYNCFYKLI